MNLARVFLSGFFLSTGLALAQTGALENAAQTKLDALLSSPTVKLKLTDDDKKTLRKIATYPSKVNRFEPDELFEIISNNVVQILVSDKVENSIASSSIKVISSGSAVAVTSKLLITNCHIFPSKNTIDKYVAVAKKNDQIIPVEFVLVDRDSDRCVLEAHHKLFQPIIGYRTINSLKVGERVYSLGYPKNFEKAIAEGLISSVKVGRSRKLLLTSTGIAKGSSGGALFDKNGFLIGITTAVISDAPHLAIVIPVEDYLSDD